MRYAHSHKGVTGSGGRRDTCYKSSTPCSRSGTEEAYNSS